MKCICGEELIHGGDHDAEDRGADPNDWLIISNFSCPECMRDVLVYEPAN